MTDPVRDMLEDLVRSSIALGWDMALMPPADRGFKSREQVIEDCARQAAPLLDRATITIRRSR